MKRKSHSENLIKIKFLKKNFLTINTDTTKRIYINQLKAVKVK